MLTTGIEILKKYYPEKIFFLPEHNMYYTDFNWISLIEDLGYRISDSKFKLIKIDELIGISRNDIPDGNILFENSDFYRLFLENKEKMGC